MTPEVIVALLSSPLLVAIPTLFLKYKDAQHRRKTADSDTVFTRLEAENARLSAQIRSAEQRIAELEQQEDSHRAEIHRLRSHVAELKRRMIELGWDEVTADGQ